MLPQERSISIQILDLVVGDASLVNDKQRYIWTTYIGDPNWPATATISRGEKANDGRHRKTTTSGRLVRAAEPSASVCVDVGIRGMRLSKDITSERETSTNRAESTCVEIKCTCIHIGEASQMICVRIKPNIRNRMTLSRSSSILRPPASIQVARISHSKRD